MLGSWSLRRLGTSVCGIPVRRPSFPGVQFEMSVHETLVQGSMREERGEFDVGLFYEKAGDGARSNVGVLCSARITGDITVDAKDHLNLHVYVKDRIRSIGEPIDSTMVEVEPLLDEDQDTEELNALANGVRNQIEKKLQTTSLGRDIPSLKVVRNCDLPFIVASRLKSQPSDALQKLLESLSPKQRLQIISKMLVREIEVHKLRHEVVKESNELAANNMTMFRHQRQQLNQQLRSLRDLCGMEQDERDTISQRYEDRLEAVHPPDVVLSTIMGEMGRLYALETSSSEYHVVRNYLDWLTQIPWGVYTPDNLDTNKAEAILNEDHYGMEDVKQRILEFIAVGSMNGSIQGKILCLTGSPGVGKTSCGKSIARALGRSFYSFSVGGMYDVSEIKGHRRTYLGAMPGKIIQALKICKTSNPVVMIDEIDKLGMGRQGDPASALLEALDPSQNDKFMDLFCDVPIDLSKVLFIATSNDTSYIPKPLLDRMEVLELSGYVTNEKLMIAKNHLLTSAFDECGLTDYNVCITDEALLRLIHDYCREAGVRNLERHISKVCRKIAYQIAQGSTEEAFVVEASDLDEYIGGPGRPSDDYYKDDSTPGIVTGLAYSNDGGSTLYIESVVLTGQPEPGLKVTGQLGDVMSESSQIAWSFAKSQLKRIDPSNGFFDSSYVHMHFPEGGIKKDGPSAGCAMVTSLLSLATKRPVPMDLGMTGEITLHGLVLPIGGLKQKCMAAQRSGLKRVIVPAANKPTYDDLPHAVTAGLKPIFATTYADVLNAAFPTMANASQLRLE